MLRLENIVKIYETYDNKVVALNGIDLDFRKNEFVSILGPSGCGKTTMLNIIGGLDHYTTGDLVIDGKSTKDFTDGDWDSYRNHSVGFVFQNYNLIPHQTVLKNVELALTLSGVSKLERKQKAIEALEKVGLGDQINKKPNQLSGGQMQRVAIARALVNNPEILLADEPTGALDTQTSIQVMEILKEVAKDRLVIMVTHNPDLALEYSTRIIKVLDGKVISDSNPYTIENFEKRVVSKKEKKKKKVSMSFFTALSLSLNNLFTKKARTLMVSFAGSIGIIGIALILSLSSGFQNYIDKVQEDTLSTYPVVIEKSNVDMTSMLEGMMGKNDAGDHELDKIYSNDIMVDMFSAIMSQVYTNNLKDFKNYIETDENFNSNLNAISYTYNMNVNIYAANTTDKVLKVNPSTIFQDTLGSQMGDMPMVGASINVWSEMLDNQDLLESQYELVHGDWPSNYNQVVLVTNEKNEVTDYALYALGLKDSDELKEILDKVNKGEKYEAVQSSFTYEDICSVKFKLVLPADMYQDTDNDGVWEDVSADKAKLKEIVNNGEEISVVGIIRPKANTSATSISGTIAYRPSLTEYVINKTNKSPVVVAQKANDKIDILTGFPFITKEVDKEYVDLFISTLGETEKAQLDMMVKMLQVQGYTQEQIDQVLIDYVQSLVDSQTGSYEKNMSKFESVDLDDPLTISLYPKSFEGKDTIEQYIKDYNAKQVADGKEENEIKYTDYIGILLSSVSSIINAVTYVLIAFVSISLVVSSIMIGVITYISVLERIKEIGILRSIGASKKDISRIFNAETLIIGFASGFLGILVTVLLCIPINLIIDALAKIGHIAALPLAGGIILVIISMGLTLIAGLIPSRIAAKKDPVEALRTE